MNGFPGEALLKEPVGRRQQRPGVTGAELAVAHISLNRRR